jgi:hypothetical protein
MLTLSFDNPSSLSMFPLILFALKVLGLALRADDHPACPTTTISGLGIQSQLQVRVRNTLCHIAQCASSLSQDESHSSKACLSKGQFFLKNKRHNMARKCESADAKGLTRTDPQRTANRAKENERQIVTPQVATFTNKLQHDNLHLGNQKKNTFEVRRSRSSSSRHPVKERPPAISLKRIIFPPFGKDPLASRRRGRRR